jgi:flagellar hook-basal body complex protein FliE
MSISAIGGIVAPTTIIGPAPVGGPGGAGGIGTTGGTGGTDFASALASGLGQVQNAQTKADDLAVKAATGSLTDVHDYMIASTEASLATQLTVAVRNKALDAFNEIMRMQA